MAMLIDSLGTTPEFAHLFSDASVLEAMLQFETALARSQARIGMIPQSAARAIAAVTPDKFDAAAIASEARSSASVVVPFVNALRTQAGEGGAGFVHWGATTQDVVDTALVLLLKRARAILDRDHTRLAAALRVLSDCHNGTLMLARTLMQPASPITFGYKVAVWYSGVAGSWKRLSQSFSDGLRLQFGGASGTLAAYGDRGPVLAAEVANELNLEFSLPWHTERGGLAAIVSNSGIYTGTLGKIARDISLLMQFEVGEVSDAGGGSSAMPHKRNPSAAAIALAAAARVPALVGAYLGAMVQEHERAAGTWQSEWQTISEVVSGTGSALAAVAGSIGTLHVFPERMVANLNAAGGAVLSEKAVILLAPGLGRDRAQQAVAVALEKAREQGKPLEEILQIELGSAGEYLGSAEIFRRKMLDSSE